MTIQDCIKLFCETNRLTYEGSYMLKRGGHRERRYEFSLEGSCETISFSTRGVRARAEVALRVQQGCKYAMALYS